jgi:hypothetical protein
VFEDVPQQIKVFNHRAKNLSRNFAKARKEFSQKTKLQFIQVSLKKIFSGKDS